MANIWQGKRGLRDDMSRSRVFGESKKIEVGIEHYNIKKEGGGKKSGVVRNKKSTSVSGY